MPKLSAGLRQTEVCVTLRTAAFVTVVQAAQLGNRHDADIGGGRDWPRAGCVIAERQVRAGTKVVFHVGLHDAAQTLSVQTMTSSRHSLGEPTRWAARRCMRSEGNDDRDIVRVAVENGKASAEPLLETPRGRCVRNSLRMGAGWRTRRMSQGGRGVRPPLPWGRAVGAGVAGRGSTPGVASERTRTVLHDLRIEPEHLSVGGGRRQSRQGAAGAPVSSSSLMTSRRVAPWPSAPAAPARSVQGSAARREQGWLVGPIENEPGRPGQPANAETEVGQQGTKCQMPSAKWE